MFKCSHRRYRQKSQGPAATTAATNLATMATDINDTHAATTRVWILAPQASQRLRALTEDVLAGSGGPGETGESKSSGASRTSAFLTLFPLLPLLSTQAPLSTWQLSDPLEMPRN
ncbi:hypothetical protein J1605_012446 [Eschrichtius robustus]|uniref:Uncharacterized protein n=1 Tax=Eschrichtius robustus TaxID=9764 RepID=A0AB34GJX3_ESCRO|nr:hypothetical protein J1605_012446 [Eschrichtius robustus]